MTNPRRRRNFIDFEVQTSLLRRMGAQWTVFLIANALGLYCWTFLINGAEGSIENHGAYFLRLYMPVLLVSLVLLPIFLMDAAKLSNRFVGPIMRVRQTLSALVSGEEAQPLKFRENDFWRSLAEDFNKVLKLNEQTKPSTEE